MSDFKHRKHIDSFDSAARGIWTAFQTQPNFKVMMVALVILVFGGIFFGLTLTEWAILILTAGLVFVAEMVNTSIEAVVDLVTKEWREEAKVAKDVGGGMVLLAVIFAVIVGLYIFLPKLLIKFGC